MANPVSRMQTQCGEYSCPYHDPRPGGWQHISAPVGPVTTSPALAGVSKYNHTQSLKARAWPLFFVVMGQKPKMKDPTENSRMAQGP